MQKSTRQLRIEERYTHRTANTERYFVELNKVKMLSADREFELATLAQTGDLDAINKLANGNLRFVVSVAKQYATNSELLMELIAQGNIGLIEAAEKFDPTRGFKFISFAVWYIRKEILHYLNTYHKTVRIPVNVLLNINRIKKIEGEIMTREGRPAIDEEIVEEMHKLGKHITLTKLDEMRIAALGSTPLDLGMEEESFSPINYLNSYEIADSITDNDDFINLKNRIFKKLSPIEKEILTKRFGLTDGLPQEFWQIADSHNKSDEWARSIYMRTVRKLKNSLATKNKKFKAELVELI